VKTIWLHRTGRNSTVFEPSLLHSSSIYFIFVSACLIVYDILLMSSVDTVLVIRLSAFRNLKSKVGDLLHLLTLEQT
jgi:hypothetical protein